MPETPKAKFKVHRDARISAAPLAHYSSVSDPALRASILQAAKFQKIAGVVQNSDSRRGIRAHLADLTRSKKALERLKAALTTKSLSALLTDFARETAERNLEMLATFEGAEQQLGLGRYGFREAPENQLRLTMSGVVVSVQLDLLVNAGADEEGNEQVGGALLHLSKTVQIPAKFKKEGTQARKHEARMAVNRFMAVLIYEQLRTNFAHLGNPSREHCIVVDPYLTEVAKVHGQLEPQLKRLRIACTEIARSWPDIAPPPDFEE
jgi:hypothetical protein